MCGRFVQRYDWHEVQDLYELPIGPARNLQAHYNVAPTDLVEVVRLDADGATEFVSMRWGLIPWWWEKPLKQVPASFNARAETVANKPMFRNAFKRNRVIGGKSGGNGMIIRFPRRRESDSLWTCRCLKTLTVCRRPN